MGQNTDYNIQVGKRLKDVRKAKGITQLQLLETIGSKSLEDGKANLIYMIERGDRRLTEANIKKIAEKYNILPGFLRLETDYMTEEEELKAKNEEFFSEQGIRKHYYHMLLTLHGFNVRYKNGYCVISDSKGQSSELDRDSLLEFISDYESHFAYQIQRMIKREADKEQTEELNNLLLTFGEGS